MFLQFNYPPKELSPNLSQTRRSFPSEKIIWDILRTYDPKAKVIATATWFLFTALPTIHSLFFSTTPITLRSNKMPTKNPHLCLRKSNRCHLRLCPPGDLFDPETPRQFLPQASLFLGCPESFTQKGSRRHSNTSAHMLPHSSLHQSPQKSPKRRTPL